MRAHAGLLLLALLACCAESPGAARESHYRTGQLQAGYRTNSGSRSPLASSNRRLHLIDGVQPGYYTDDVCTPETCNKPGAVPGSCVIDGRFPKCTCLPGFAGNLCETNPGVNTPGPCTGSSCSPGPPTITSVAASITSLTVFFAPPDDVTEPVIQYVAKAVPQGGGCTDVGAAPAVAAAASPIEIAGLSPGTAYTLYVWAAGSANAAIPLDASAATCSAGTQAFTCPTYDSQCNSCIGGQAIPLPTNPSCIINGTATLGFCSTPPAGSPSVCIADTCPACDLTCNTCVSPGPCTSKSQPPTLNCDPEGDAATGYCAAAVNGQSKCEAVPCRVGSGARASDPGCSGQLKWCLETNTNDPTSNVCKACTENWHCGSGFLCQTPTYTCGAELQAPGPPATVTPAADGSSVSWSAPTTGGPVSSFDVTLTDSTGSVIGSWTGISSNGPFLQALPSLSTGTYTVEVKAVGPGGSASKTASLELTVVGAPGAPSITSLDAVCTAPGACTATVAWSAASGAVDQYTVSVTPPGGSAAPTQTAFLAFTFTVSQAGMYGVAVTALGANGAVGGTTSASLTITCLVGTGDEQTNDEGCNGNNNLKWCLAGPDDPMDNQCQECTADAHCSGGYYCDTAAVSGVSATYTCEPEAPGMPQAVTAAADGSSVTWSAPATGGPISTYEVTLSGSKTGSWTGIGTAEPLSQAVAATATGAYTVVVRAVGPGGSASTTINFSIAPPGAPSITSLDAVCTTPGACTATVDWSAASGAVDQYTVSVTPPGSSAMETQGASSPFTFTVLKAGVYGVVVTALGANGAVGGATSDTLTIPCLVGTDAARLNDPGCSGSNSWCLAGPANPIDNQCKACTADTRCTSGEYCDTGAVSGGTATYTCKPRAPGAVGSISLAPGGTSISWTAPTTGGTVTSYEVQVSGPKSASQTGITALQLDLTSPSSTIGKLGDGSWAVTVKSKGPGGETSTTSIGLLVNVCTGKSQNAACDKNGDGSDDGLCQGSSSPWTCKACTVPVFVLVEWPSTVSHNLLLRVGPGVDAPTNLAASDAPSGVCMVSSGSTGPTYCTWGSHLGQADNVPCLFMSGTCSREVVQISSFSSTTPPGPWFLRVTSSSGSGQAALRYGLVQGGTYTGSGGGGFSGGNMVQITQHYSTATSTPISIVATPCLNTFNLGTSCPDGSLSNRKKIGFPITCDILS